MGAFSDWTLEAYIGPKNLLKFQKQKKSVRQVKIFHKNHKIPSKIYYKNLSFTLFKLAPSLTGRLIGLGAYNNFLP